MVKLLKRKIGGFSLIEILISMVVLAVGLIAIAKFQGTIIQNSGDVHVRTEAIHLAQKKAEELKAYTTLNDYDTLDDGSETITVTNTVFNVSWDVTAYTNPSYKNVALNVAWTDPKGSAQSIKVDSIVSRTDPKASGVLAMSYIPPSPSASSSATPSSSSSSAPSSSSSSSPSSSASSSPSSSPSASPSSSPEALCSCKNGSLSGHGHDSGCSNTCCSQHQSANSIANGVNYIAACSGGYMHGY